MVDYTLSTDCCYSIMGYSPLFCPTEIPGVWVGHATLGVGVWWLISSSLARLDS